MRVRFTADRVRLGIENYDNQEIGLTGRGGARRERKSDGGRWCGSGRPRLAMLGRGWGLGIVRRRQRGANSTSRQLGQRTLGAVQRRLAGGMGVENGNAAGSEDNDRREREEQMEDANDHDRSCSTGAREWQVTGPGSPP
jgi:hypothetical protein